MDLSEYGARAHGSEPSRRTAREGADMRAHQCVVRARARKLSTAVNASAVTFSI
ncbi:hypothetical protein Hanom_Chr06g00500681 [Helianthus anomalus]